MIDSVIGRPWGNYRVTEKIGVGGMGVVYRMDHKTLPRRKALKVLRPPVFAEDIRRLLQEAVAACAIDTDRIVRVDDIGDWPDGACYIVMEWIDGRSLADELRERKFLPVDITVKLLFRLADTMALAHANGIVHRDLKPANILFPRDSYIPKICDFGIASVATAPAEIQWVKTQDRKITGTPGYQSPEQIAALPTDGRTDIYSLGVIGFEALAGELPHPPLVSYNPVNAAQFFTRPVPSIASKRPRLLPPVPAMVEYVIARALAMDVGRRYTTAIEFRDALGECLAMMRADEDGVMHNALLTKMTMMADERATAPALRTPAGYVDGIIHELRAHSGPVTFADVTATIRRTINAPTEIIADPVSLGGNGGQFPSANEIQAIYRILHRRFDLASHRVGGLTPKQRRLMSFLHAFHKAGRITDWEHIAVSLRLMADVLIDFSPSEVALLADMLKAVREGRKALAAWIATEENALRRRSLP